jgi:hypothetical protein
VRRIKFVEILIREVEEREREREIRRGVEQLSSSQDSGGVGAIGEKRIRNN